MRGQTFLSRSDITSISRSRLAAVAACFSLVLFSCPNPVSVDQVASDLGLSVVATIPPNGATDFDPAQPIVVSFNKDLDPACLQGIPPVVVAPNSGKSLTLTLSYDSATKKLIIDPHPFLESNSTYTVSFETTLKDSSGETLPKRVDFTFTTGNGPAGDIQINGGAPYVTTSDTVTLAVQYNKSAEYVRTANSAAGLSTAPDTPVTASPLPWTLDTGEGTRTVYMQFFNADRSLSSPMKSVSIVRDTQKPYIQSVSAPRSYNASNNDPNPATVTAAASDETSGVDTYAWNGAGVDFNTSPPYSAQSPRITIGGADGSYNISVTVKDRAGNSTTSQNMTVVADTSAPGMPSPTLDVTASPTLNRNGIQWSWNNSSNTNLYATPADTLRVTMNGSSETPNFIAPSVYGYGPISVNSDDTYTVTVVQVDAAGNESLPLVMPIIVTPVIPYDGSTNQSSSPNLQWRDFRNEGGSNGQSVYRVHIWPSANPSQEKVRTVPGIDPFLLLDLDPHLTYYWYIEFSPDGTNTWTRRSPSTPGAYYQFTVQ